MHGEEKERISIERGSGFLYKPPHAMEKSTRGKRRCALRAGNGQEKTGKKKGNVTTEKEQDGGQVNGPSGPLERGWTGESPPLQVRGSLDHKTKVVEGRKEERKIWRKGGTLGPEGNSIKTRS